MAALARARAACGLRSPLVAEVHNQLGMLGKATGDFTTARRHYQRALEIIRRHPHHDSLELADLYHNLGGLEHVRGRFVAGELLARRAVTLRARRHGTDATSTWLDRTAHAALLDGLARSDASVATYRAALVRFRRRLGPGHHEVAVTLNNLGCALAAQGQTREALRHLRRSLVLKERRFGPAHVEVATALNNLATALRDVGRRSEARALFRRALAIFRRRLGDRHPSTRTCRAHLA